MAREFEWDDVKASVNKRKHGITFDEAASMLESGSARIQPDPDHSLTEDRARAIGFSEKGRLIVVVFTERESVTRIISARRATHTESRWYAENQT